jgi:hypothetical protein
MSVSSSCNDVAGAAHAYTAMFEVLERRVFLSAAPTAAPVANAPADGHAPHVYAPHSTVRGQDMGDWAADWLKWALSAPTDQNPLVDTTGADAGFGQPKDVFFLAGTFGSSTPVTRDVTVPTGTPLFFPILNAFWVTVEGVDPPFEEFEPDVRELFQQVTDAYTDVFLTIDGVSVGNLDAHVERDAPGGFLIDFPEDNVFGLPPEMLGLSATHGIYTMVAPLKPGEHVVHFGGTDPSFGGVQDISYNITVVPKGQYRKAVSSSPSSAGAAHSAGRFNTTRRIASSILSDGADDDFMN